VRKSLTLALLALVLVSLATAAWAGDGMGVLAAPVELLSPVEGPRVVFARFAAAPRTCPIATVLLRGPPSTGLAPQTTRTPDQETAWRRNADWRRSSPT
jgi:hypothetical protein